MLAALGSNRRAVRRSVHHFGRTGMRRSVARARWSMLGSCVFASALAAATPWATQLARGTAGPAIPGRHRRRAPEPASRRLVDVAPDAEQLGLQPAPGHHREQRPHSADGVDARTRAWPPGGHAARARRRDVLPQPARRRRSHRREDRRSEMAVPSEAARGSRQVLPGARHQPEPGDLRQPHHRHECRRLRLRA